MRTRHSVTRLPADPVLLEVVAVVVAAAVRELVALPVQGVVVPPGEVRPARTGAGRLRAPH